MKTYNGYKNHSYWNQSLWINNDAQFYFLALESINKYKNVKLSTLYFIDALTHCYTPDNVLWTKAAVYSALVSLKKESI